MNTNEPINIHQAKTHLSRLIQRALDGEEVVIAKAGKPLVKLVAIQPDEDKPTRRIGGELAGQIWIADDFDAPDPELEALFYDGPIFPDEKPADAAESGSDYKPNDTAE